MLTLDQCIRANRPLIFVTAESDFEVLMHIKNNYVIDKDDQNILDKNKNEIRDIEKELSNKFSITYNEDNPYFSVVIKEIDRLESLLEFREDETALKELTKLYRYKNLCNFRIDNWHIYTSTISSIVPLKTILKDNFKLEKPPKAQTLVTNLDDILKKIYKNNTSYDRYIFLDTNNTLQNDPQAVRKIKDIMSRYQTDIEFTMSLIFISSSISVPQQLERLGEIVNFDLPDEFKIKDLSNEISTSLKLKGKRAPNEEIVNNLKGLTLFEIEQAYLQSFHLYQKIDENFIKDFKKNSISKTDLLTLLESNISFNNIGGMDILKKWIKKSYGGWTVEGKKFGLPLLKGLLLIGPPGSGKSLICKAIGNEWNLPVVNFDPSRIFSSGVGDSEANMRRVLNIVERLSPAILMIDEIEKGLSGLQSSSFSDSGVTARVIGSFLIWMQECTKPVFIVATANNIQNLPPELISRFDETFFVNLPQASERQDIFKIHLNKLNRNPDNFDLISLANNSKDFSGREIEQTLRDAMYEAFYNKQDITTEMILKVLSKKTNILTTMAEQLKYLIDWVGYDEKKKDGLRARFANTPDTMDMDRVQNEIDSILKDIEKKKPFER